MKMKRGQIFPDPMTQVGRTNDWNVPCWNTPMAQDFIAARKQIDAMFARLTEIETCLDEQEKQLVTAELGEGLEPTTARLAHARFLSEEWQQAWQEFSEAVCKARELAHEATKE
jgi:hypothetical protein